LFNLGTRSSSENELDILLISLEKKEKRAFKLYVRQFGDPARLKFVQLYDLLIAHPSCTAVDISALNPKLKKAQIPNLRAELLRHLMESLRISHQAGVPEAEIRKQLDHAGILFDRGMLHHAMRRLNKARKMAEKAEISELLFEILQRQKLVEMHFSVDMDLHEASALRALVEDSARQARIGGAYAGLALELRAVFVKDGFARNEAQFKEVKVFFNERIPTSVVATTRSQRLHYHRCYFWLNYILQDFKQCYRHASSAIALLSSKGMGHQQVSLLKFYNALLNSLFRMNQPQRFQKELTAFEALQDTLSGAQAKSLWVGYRLRHDFNERFLFGNFSNAELVVKEAAETLREEPLSSNSLNLKYKMASLLFGGGNFEACLKQLNEILHLEDASRRKDLHRFARILKLATLLELKELDHLFALVPSTYHFLVRVGELNAFQRVILRFLGSMARKNKLPEILDWQELRSQMEEVVKNPFERRPFFYFDIISWLDAKILNKTVAEVIRQRGLGHEASLH
jgi:hypothetical protein